MSFGTKHLSVAAACIAVIAMSASCTVGQVAYMEPAGVETETSERGKKLAEYCFSGPYAGSLNAAFAEYTNTTGKSTWTDVNLTHASGFAKDCYELTEQKGGAN